MAQPATGPAESPGKDPSKTLADPAVHPVDEKLPRAARPRRAPAHRRHVRGRRHPSAHHRPGRRPDTAGMTRLIAASLLIAGLATILQTIGLGPSPETASLRQRRLLRRDRADARHRRDQRTGTPTPRDLRGGARRRSVLPGRRPLLRPAAALSSRRSSPGWSSPSSASPSCPCPSPGRRRRRHRRRLRCHEVPGAGRLHPRRHPARPAFRARLPQSKSPCWWACSSAHWPRSRSDSPTSPR